MAIDSAHDPKPFSDGRAAQRRRTRRAILAAATKLVLEGHDPSIADIAHAADVSRRTVYTYFPTLDHLILEASLTSMSDVEDALAEADPADVRQRVRTVIEVIYASIEQTIPLGRKMVRLTVDAPIEQGAPRRGYRRVRWFETALEPWRASLDPTTFERAVSELAVVIGWESYIVLADVRALSHDEAFSTTVHAAMAILDAIAPAARTHEAATTPGRNRRRRTR